LVSFLNYQNCLLKYRIDFDMFNYS